MYVIFAVTLVAALIPMATAQDTKALPPMHLYGSGSVIHVPVQRGARAVAPFFCKTGCLYYSGDDDSTNSNNNGLFDIENAGIGITDAEVWVGVKPTKAATMTGTSGNYFNTASGIGTNPTPVEVQTGITSGKAGKLTCSTSGTATFKTYGNPNFGLNSDNYWVKKTKKACKLAAKKANYIWMSPQYNDTSTIGYLEDSDGAHKNKHGYKEDTNDGFFNSSSFGVTYEPTNGSSGACGGIGCIGFSISVSGH